VLGVEESDAVVGRRLGYSLGLFRRTSQARAERIVWRATLLRVPEADPGALPRRLPFTACCLSRGRRVPGRVVVGGYSRPGCLCSGIGHSRRAGGSGPRLGSVPGSGADGCRKDSEMVSAGCVDLVSADAFLVRCAG